MNAQNPIQAPAIFIEVAPDPRDERRFEYALSRDNEVLQRRGGHRSQQRAVSAGLWAAAVLAERA